jgi:hypothetical protein
MQRMRFFAVVDDSPDEAVEFFLDRRDAERVVEDWDRDEPDQAGLLHVAVIDLDGEDEASRT